jgi:hypothetical protein
VILRETVLRPWACHCFVSSAARGEDREKARVFDLVACSCSDCKVRRLNACIDLILTIPTQLPQLSFLQFLLVACTPDLLSELLEL